MKEVWILVIILLLIFLPNYYFKNYLKHSGEELISVVKHLDNNLKNIETVDNEEANELKQEFWKKEKIWILIVDHDMLDEIENSVEDCVAYYDTNYKNEFHSSALKLIDAIEDLSKREEISFANIL